MPSSPPPAEFQIPRVERWLGLAFLGFALGLRIFYAYHFRIDSDEPQHLHVVWAWTQGLLPYRDVFDNHTPVFQALCAPLFRMLGVRADILLPMRLAMLPIFALTIWCVWKCARSFFGSRTALWTAVFAVLCPPFFLTSIEFRPDELWTLAWLLTLRVLVTGPLTTARIFVGGLLLGFAFSVSMKTSLLLAALAFAGTGTLIFRRRTEAIPVKWLFVCKSLAAALLGMCVVPALVVAFFVAQGAGAAIYYCVIQHNILPGAGGLGRIMHSTAHWLPRLLPVIGASLLIVRLELPAGIRRRIVFTFLAAAFYYTLLVSFWPILTAEDYLPFFPAAMITAGPALLWLADLASRSLRLPGFALPALVSVAALAGIVRTENPFTDETTDKLGMVADTLKLTDPGDYVMDSKGETIFRRRPFYFVLEGLTNKRLGLGLIKDNIPQRLAETRTPLATLRRLHHPTKDFVESNYLPIAFRLLVAGQVLRTDSRNLPRQFGFELAIPQRYTIVCAGGPVAGLLDGTPFDGARELTAGHHEFVQTDGARGQLVLVWAQAVERGYSPFAKIKHDYRTEQD